MTAEWRIEDGPLGRVLIPPRLPENSGLFYTSKDFGGRLAAASITLLSQFMRETFSIDVTFTSCNQVHGVAAQTVSSPLTPWVEYRDCDALITRLADVALGIKVADCLPVTLVDPDGHLVANIHCGWRGAAGSIVTRTLHTAARTGLVLSSTLAYLGPSIRSCCLEVGEEVAESFQQNYPRAEEYFTRNRGTRPYLDIPALTRQSLLDCGVPAAQIFDSEICTRCDGSIFHSYRRDGKTGGRNLAVVAQTIR